jgi:hypothetical protein
MPFTWWVNLCKIQKKIAPSLAAYSFLSSRLKKWKSPGLLGLLHSCVSELSFLDCFANFSRVLDALGCFHSMALLSLVFLEIILPSELVWLLLSISSCLTVWDLRPPLMKEILEEKRMSSHLIQKFLHFSSKIPSTQRSPSCCLRVWIVLFLTMNIWRVFIFALFIPFIVLSLWSLFDLMKIVSLYFVKM